MRISDWSSDVCSSDLSRALGPGIALGRDSGSGPAATVNGRPRALRFRAVALPGPLAPRGARQSRRLHRNSGAARLVRTISVKCAMPPRARENRGPGSIATTSSRRFLPPHDRLGIGIFEEAFEPALEIGRAHV